ncbi:MAG TPA: hypothetical protein VL003_09765 [Pusillimonas sp.]|uniref:hypothetical protein n=1 Tax=Pusillimonas sp. TaxID=3040095 RepID=UPI002BFE583B|nr:hypothetical protein [Pusillimonas sp.]HUH88322.1 hypothetical protein [Pusillimonas sp.]
MASIHIKGSIHEQHRDELTKQTALAVLDELRGTVVMKAHETMAFSMADPETA